MCSCNEWCGANGILLEIAGPKMGPIDLLRGHYMVSLHMCLAGSISLAKW